MSLSKTVILALLGFCLAGSAFARTWTTKDGDEIEGDFVKYDAAAKKITIKIKVVDKEVTISQDALSDNDLKWVMEHVGAGDGKPVADKEIEVKGAKDEIFALLGKSPEEVGKALKNMKLVENIDSLQIRKVLRTKDNLEEVIHTYDNGKFGTRFLAGKLTVINLNVMNGYAGPLPFGFKKDMTQNDTQEILKKLDFRITDWGRADPGWGVAHSPNDGSGKIVAIMTQEVDSPELAIVRLKIAP